MTCHNCGADNPPTYKFCASCGNEFEQIAAPVNPPPFINYSTPVPPNRNLLIFGGIGVGFLACLCVCGMIFAGTYLIQNTNVAFAQPTARATLTRRPITPTPTDTTAAVTSSPADSGLVSPSPNQNSATISASTPAASKKWTSTEVAHAFQSARLEFSNPRSMTNDDYGSVPRVATEGTRFFLPSLGGQKGGRIFAFATAKDLQTVQQYYSGAGLSHILIHDNILVQIHSDLSESLAKKYQTALDSLQ